MPRRQRRHPACHRHPPVARATPLRRKPGGQEGKEDASSRLHVASDDRARGRARVLHGTTTRCMCRPCLTQRCVPRSCSSRITTRAAGKARNHEMEDERQVLAPVRARARPHSPMAHGRHTAVHSPPRHGAHCAIDVALRSSLRHGAARQPGVAQARVAPRGAATALCRATQEGAAGAHDTLGVDAGSLRAAAG